MIKRALLATAAAGFLAVAALPATASAAGYNQNPNFAVQFGGPGWSLQFGNPPPRFAPPPRQFCQPVVQKVKWWDNFGRPHWSNVVVGNKCAFGGPGFGPGGFPGGFHPGQGGGFPGGFPGQGGGYHPGPWNGNGQWGGNGPGMGGWGNH